MFDAFSNESPTSAVPEGTPEPSVLNRGSRDAIVNTAERIGSAVGTAQRQMRRGFELVRRPQSRVVSFPETAQSAQIAQRPPDMWREVIAEQISDARLRASQQIEQLRTEASEHVQRLRRDSLDYAESHPLQTIAAIAAAGFVLGFALRINRRSRRG